ncbi:MAG: S1C family serine protease [Candidatus Dormibacteria bacterium]
MRLVAPLAALFALLAGVWTAFPVRAADAVDPLRRSADLAAPSVVLISLQGSMRLTGISYLTDPIAYRATGTGFFISSDGYIGTANHVVAPPQDEFKALIADALYNYLLKKVTSAGGCDEQCQYVSNHFDQILASNVVLSSDTQIRVFTQDMDLTNPATSGIPAVIKTADASRDNAIIKIDGHDEPVLEIGQAATVQTGDSISLIGYPGGTFVGQGAVTSLASALVPSVTHGTITAKKQGSKDFLGLSDTVQLFQTDASADHGSSGGPAIDTQGHVIGLIFAGSTGNAQFLITSADINDSATQVGVNNSLSTIDQLWRTGLSYFDQHRYIKARAAFDQCVALNHAQVGCAQWSARAQPLLDQDQESRYTTVASKSSPLGSASNLVPVMGLGLALLIFAGTGALVLFRRRPRVAIAPSSAYAPPAGPVYAPPALGPTGQPLYTPPPAPIAEPAAQPAPPAYTPPAATYTPPPATHTPPAATYTPPAAAYTPPAAAHTPPAPPQAPSPVQTTPTPAYTPPPAQAPLVRPGQPAGTPPPPPALTSAAHREREQNHGRPRMVKCRNCRLKYPAEAWWCPHCGEKPAQPGR